MSKLNKLFLTSILIGVVFSIIILVMPTSIYDFYPNPEVYDTGFSYYLWKFKDVDQSIMSRITSWLFFGLHLISTYYLLKKLREDKHKNEYSKYNIYLLLMNGFFILLHYVHTWIWYDALAQDTPVWSSQGSVIVMLVIVLILENNRRGLFFGKKMNFPKESTNFFMKHHGKYIALATIFTFWYHPMENTIWHITGFFYMYLLFIQISFTRTKLHTNKLYIVVLELMVLIHGVSVALFSGNAPWEMFFFGFLAIFFITQIYALKLSKRAIHISQALFMMLALATYSGVFNDVEFYEINEVIRIPFIEYGLVFIFVYIIYIIKKLSKN